MVALRALDGTVDAATSVVCPGLSGVLLPGYAVRGTRHAFGTWAVEAWPELTDAILTALGPVKRAVGRGGAHRSRPREARMT
jgi:hypothetical protein